MAGSFASETVAALQQSTCMGSVSAILSHTATELGFQYFAMAQSNISRTDIGSLVALNYPDDFLRYQAETLGYFNSPVLLAVRSQCAPFEWRDLKKLIDLKPTHIDYLQMAASFGLENGFTIPIHIPGEPSGFVSFVRNDGGPFEPENLAMAHFLATHAFSAGRRIRDLAAAGTVEVLNEHDRTIITLIARGKSKFAIARKLQVSEETVAESLKRTRRYYRVGSQTQAVVEALYDRSIGFQDVIK